MKEVKVKILQQVQLEYVTERFKANNFNREDTCKELAISIRTLGRILMNFNVPRPKRAANKITDKISDDIIFFIILEIGGKYAVKTASKFSNKQTTGILRYKIRELAQQKADELNNQPINKK